MGDHRFVVGEGGINPPLMVVALHAPLMHNLIWVHALKSTQFRFEKNRRQKMPEIQLDYSFPGGVPEPPHALHESVKSRLDPEYVGFFNEHMTEASKLLYTHRVPLNETRAGGNVMPGQAELCPLSKTFDVKIPRKHTDASAPEIPARVFVPVGTPPANGWPLFIWFHGGGWVLGNITTENSFCSKIAHNSQCVVVSVDYRLAPEDIFPAAVDDAFEAVLYSFEEAPSAWGIDNTKIGIGGSSAGGNLTATVTHKYASSALSEKLPKVRLQLLVVPVTDNTAFPHNSQSWNENEFTPQLPSEKMIWYRKLYLPDEKEWTNPEASPLFYLDESFAKVPPCLIAAAECDVLRSEAEKYHEKLEKNGVSLKLIIYKGVPHPVMAMDAVLEKGRQLGNDATEFIKTHFQD